MTDYRYRFLPSGNSRDFPWIDEEMKRRGIRAEFSETPTGGRLYRLPVDDVSKLPVDDRDGEHYFGNEETGWSLFELSEETASYWETVRLEWNSDWVSAGA